MGVGDLKQHIPIFVGSTFVDMQEYRRAAQDSLIQLETIVRGMEYFGSKPGSPVDECLSSVKSCQIYIGIFGMRYGTVPEGHSKSMTHLEYEEAQQNNLPSLIYIIDEESQPILPKFVETGDGAKALRNLKEELRNKHVVSLFTTPEDLSRRVLHDVAEVVSNIGITLEGSLPSMAEMDSTEMWRLFKLMPKMVRDQEVIIEFNIDRFWSVEANECESLRLETGATVKDYVRLSDNDNVYAYASGEVAKKLIFLPKGALVKANASTIFGVTQEVEYADNGTITINTEHRGVRIIEVLDISLPSEDESG